MILTTGVVYAILYPFLSIVYMGLLTPMPSLGKEVKCRVNTNAYRER